MFIQKKMKLVLFAKEKKKKKNGVIHIHIVGARKAVYKTSKVVREHQSHQQSSNHLNDTLQLIVLFARSHASCFTRNVTEICSMVMNVNQKGMFVGWNE